MAPGLFKNFDFNLLDSPDFKEDSVREELITPLLHALGYQVRGEFQILRSKSLTHPFVMIGSKRHKINIVPDCLLRVKNNFAWVLDAKHPNQKVVNDTNVEQVYSYAIHPEVRVNLYALCNGSELAVFHIGHVEPILQIDLRDIESKWPEVENLLSPYTVLSYRPKPKNLYPDYGLHLYKLGYTDQEVDHFFYNLPIDHVDRVTDETLSILMNLAPDGVEFALSFDFGFERLAELVQLAPEGQRLNILNGLRRQPYKVDIVPPFLVNIEARLGSATKTEVEDIMPMIVTKFLPA
ncbi:type I restriction enzyme HsdR N-terminal domain-containing protein [Phormidium tenue]|uniref:Uncharacterized protein n=1 Tax=Phormidium tenue NIES-30 TaxID=549789 RepID=A0A1U7J8T4_9CYAN|nr:type I restriction enzyme HsdR N-terminal domain-containing protein [Phormidium tenue]MBD2231050.1 type I restriction enzyme HsdR N-terminal domain-containing protein [Phormidium tenue FACHB-1052]OKH49916.1 hypothetical protein NIES30_04180 [Phormidium tenue NIES-30]